MTAYPDAAVVQATAPIFLGRTFMKAGRMAEAETFLLRGRELAHRFSVHSEIIQADHNLFHVYEALGDTARARAAGYAYINSSQSKVFDSARMMAYHDLGWYFWQRGNYEEAQPLLNRMLASIDSMRSYRHYAGEYYERLGDIERALQMFDSAALVDRIDYRPMARRAVLAAQLGDRRRAIQLAQAHDTVTDPAYPEFTPQLPGILATFGMYEDAIRAAMAAEVRARSRGQVAAVANLQLEHASLAFKLGKHVLASELADSARRNARSVSAYETATMAEAVRLASLAMSTRKASYLDSLREYAESRAVTSTRTLEHSVQNLAGITAAGVNDKGVAFTAFRRASDLNDLLAASFTTDFDRARFRSAANDVTGRALSLVIRSTAHDVKAYLEWSTRRKAKGIVAQRVTSLPRPAANEAIIDYVVLDSVVAALVVTRRQHVLRKLPIQPRALNELITSLNEQLTPRVGALLDVRRSRFDVARAHQLYRALLEPLQADLEDATHLVIVPDGPLHYLSFDALVVQPRRSLRYAVEDYTIRYTPSLALAMSDNNVVRGSALVFTGAAPHAEPEAEAVAARTSSQLSIMPVAVAASTESRVRGFAPQARILHFATHAVPNDASPLFAYLALQSDGSDDGKLHAFEIEKLKLNGALVVLSGCDTGRGYLAGGEGVLSLSRAFLRAGAVGTIATLWPVGDGAPEFMAEFYGSLARGVRPAEALRQTKLHVLKGRYANPLYWAPFVIITT